MSEIKSNSKADQELTAKQKKNQLGFLDLSMPSYALSPHEYKDWTPFRQFVSKCGLTVETANDLLQSHGYFDGKEYEKRFHHHGIIINVPEYYGITPEFGIIKYFNETLVSPHGQQWLEEFFENAEMIFNPQM